MEVNKVDFANGETLIDLTSDTVTPQTLVKGVTAHNSKGEQIIGNLNPEGGGSGGGIIDVTELPTENIDENAVYRLTENIQVEKNEIYIHTGGGAVTLSQYLASLGVPTIPNIYAVDELPSDMKVSDVQTFSEIHCYILKSDGIAYMNVPAYGGIITVGLFGFRAMGYDKGFTEDINAETEIGVYTTIEAYKQVVRWFIRENGEWEEITAYVKFDNPHGLTDTNVVSGDITAVAYSASDLLERAYTEIDESWFLKADGTYVNRVSNYVFAYSNSLKTATLPSFIDIIGVDVFTGCPMLKTVTLKSKPTDISQYAFRNNVYATVLTTINVPWAEGEVPNAPWGATNATINYNYTGE